jgi:MFS family permease
MTISPKTPDVIRKNNFKFVLIDAIGVSISNVAAPFLPVFLTRMGATNFQVGLLSTMPGITGLLLAMFVGRFLQKQKNIIPWYGISRLLVISSYAVTGLITLFAPNKFVILGTLSIWALASIPQIALSIAFSVVMNEVAGPEGRYQLLSRRWAIFGITSVIFTFFITRIINLIAFPMNYGFMFLGLSLGGLLSYTFSRKIIIPNQDVQADEVKQPIRERLKQTYNTIASSPLFVTFSLKRFVYLSAIAMSGPILPLYFVNVVRATDKQIGTINMMMTIVMLLGYVLWPKISAKKGGRFVLLMTTAGMISYPFLTALTTSVNMIYGFAIIAGLFQSGLDLVFFDELMKTVPLKYSAIFVSVAQGMQYLSTMVAPLAGTFIADQYSLSTALLVSAMIRLIGFLLFAIPNQRSRLSRSDV